MSNGFGNSTTQNTFGTTQPQNQNTFGQTQMTSWAKPQQQSSWQQQPQMSNNPWEEEERKRQEMPQFDNTRDAVEYAFKKQNPYGGMTKMTGSLGDISYYDENLYKPKEEEEKQNLYSPLQKDNSPIENQTTTKIPDEWHQENFLRQKGETDKKIGDLQGEIDFRNAELQQMQKMYSKNKQENMDVYKNILSTGLRGGKDGAIGAYETFNSGPILSPSKEGGILKVLGKLAEPFKLGTKALPGAYAVGGLAGAGGTSLAEYNFSENQRANIAASQESLEKQMREEEERIKRLMEEMQRLRR